MTEPALPVRPARRRWQRAALALLIATVIGATVGVVALVVQSSALLGRLTTGVSTAQQRTTNLVNTQREALRLLQQVTELRPGADVEAVTVRRGLLGRQLGITTSVFPGDSPQHRELTEIQAALATFPWEGLDEPKRAAILRTTAMALASQVEVRVTALYHEQETYFYEATLHALEAKRENQNALTGLVALVVVLGICWVVMLKRRTRSDLARAYNALVGEMGERRSAEKALRASEERFRSLVQRASDLTAVTDADGMVGYLSPAAKEILGYDPDELIGRPLLEHIHADDRPRVADLLAQLRGEPSAAATIELRVTTRDRRVRTLEVLCRNLLADPAVAGMVWNGRDITDRRALQDQLSHQAYHDSLTGLPNRALFMRRLADALRQAEDSGGSASAVLIDLDGFKNVNDTLGHAAGDELLQRAAERLRGCILDGDTVARLGGDEFAIVIPGGVAEHATAVSRRVITALRRPISAGGQEVRVSASIGVALLAGQQTAEDLLSDADIAMYEAKRSGKGRYQVFEQEMRERTSQRTRLEQQLARAVGLGQIEVHYQPIVDLRTNEVTAMEALARWRRSDGELMQPGLFIPVADEAGLIGEIGREVLRKACQTVHRWRRSVPGSASLGVTVNVSGWQILSTDYSLQVADTLAETGLPPDALTLEITESMLLEDSEALAAELGRIKALNIGLAMDDFGAGYSSLSSLLRFKVDTLKIDRMFLDYGKVSLLRAVVELGRTLGLKVVAEGVEDADQLELVRSANCDAVQGFLISKPLPEADARFFLERAGTTSEISLLLTAAARSA
jgi:diguanylate cyclase (GGDEF)-like protein/PAS domain S-box-containing protein